MGLMLIGHILGDFYIQTDGIADKKRKSFKYMLLHGLLYTIGIYIVLLSLKKNYLFGIMVAIAIGILHICIDLLKVQFETKIIKLMRYESIIFLVDQIIHIGVLLLICYFFNIHFNVSLYSFLHGKDVANVQKAIAIIVAALICWKPAAIFISLVFQVIPKTVEAADIVEQENDVEAENNKYEVTKIGS